MGAQEKEKGIFSCYSRRAKGEKTNSCCVKNLFQSQRFPWKDLGGTCWILDPHLSKFTVVAIFSVLSKRQMGIKSKGGKTGITWEIVGKKGYGQPSRHQ